MLSLIVFLPLVGVIAIALLGNSGRGVKLTAMVFHFLVLVLTVYLWANFDFSQSGIQFLEQQTWVREFGITYTLGVDGISLPMLLLTSILFALTAVYSWGVKSRVKEFYPLMLLLQVGITGVFVSFDLFLFFVFWELVLIPMYFIIAVWGGPAKEHAATKFILYTHVGSLVMLLMFIAIALEAAPRLGGLTFNMLELGPVAHSFSMIFQLVVFGALLFSFGVKMPLVPLHTWLPAAHVEAPTEGSIILAALLLKMGAYGLIRIALGLLPGGAEAYASFMALIAVVTILYGSLICVAQRDLKRMIAFSSVGHMGMVLLGVSTLSDVGIAGGVYQMFAHGLTTAALFMMAGSIHHSTGTRIIQRLGGISARMPRGAFALTSACLAGAALPGMALFVSEFTVFLAAFRTFNLWMVIPALTIVITAGYFLWALQRAIFGPYNESLGEIKDLHAHEFIPLGTLAVLLIIFGVFPFMMMDALSVTSAHLAAFIGGI
ncbi:MAG: NuoM family protein [Candidatus Bathyarchaeia archaeon]